MYQIGSKESLENSLWRILDTKVYQKVLGARKLSRMSLEWFEIAHKENYGIIK